MLIQYNFISSQGKNFAFKNQIKESCKIDSSILQTKLFRKIDDKIYTYKRQIFNDELVCLYNKEERYVAEFLDNKLFSIYDPFSLRIRRDLVNGDNLPFSTEHLLKIGCDPTKLAYYDPEFPLLENDRKKVDSFPPTFDVCNEYPTNSQRTLIMVHPFSIFTYNPMITNQKSQTKEDGVTSQSNSKLAREQKMGSESIKQLILPPTHRTFIDNKRIDVLVNENINLRTQIIKQNEQITNLRSQITLLLQMQKGHIDTIEDYTKKYEDVTKQLKIQAKENKILQNENEKLNNRISNILKDIDYYKNSNKTITYEDVINFFTQAKPPFTTPLGWNLQKELFINSFRHTNHSQHSDVAKKFYWIVGTQGYTSYSTLHGIIRTPTFTTMNKLISPRLQKLEVALLDIKYISQIMNDFHKHYNITQEYRATLAIDAIAVSPAMTSEFKSQLNSQSKALLLAYNSQIHFRQNVLKEKYNDILNELHATNIDKKKEKLQSKLNKLEEKMNEEMNLNDMFIFYIQPNDPAIPCFPIHLWLQQGGNANLVVRELTKEIIIQVDKTLCTLCASSTDGDLGHQYLYEQAMKLLASISPELNIEDIKIYFQHNPMPPLAIADMLHYSKTLRLKVLKYPLSLFVANTFIIFDFQTNKCLFPDKPEFTKIKGIDKMRDIYPIRFFSLEYDDILIQQRIWCGILFHIPWTCWMAAITNTLFTPKARVFLLKITFEFARRFYNILTTKEKWDENVKEFHKTDCFCTFTTKSAIERVIPTLTTIIIELERFIDFTKEHSELTGCDLALDRLGTHPLENLNGDIRNVCKGNDTIVRATKVVAKAHLLKLLSCELGLSNIHKGRVNTGGVRLSQCINVLDSPELEITESQLVDSIFLAAEAGTPETLLGKTFSSEAVNKFFEYIHVAYEESIKHDTLPKLNTPDITKNQTIITKLFGYKSNE